VPDSTRLTSPEISIWFPDPSRFFIRARPCGCGLSPEAVLQQPPLPKLQVTNHCLIRHRLLDFGDIVAYFFVVDGMMGRPTTGLLYVLCKVIGEGRMNCSRIILADNGKQVARGGASKEPFRVTETIFVRPDGTGAKGPPAKTAEWLAIEERLKQQPRIEYHDWALPDCVPAW